MPEHPTISAAPVPAGHYSPVVKANGFVFLSGQIALTADGPQADADVETQARIVCRNITATIGELGLGWSDVVKVTIFLTDMDDFGVVNGVYAEAVGLPAPARSTVAVAALPRGMKVEIELIAAER